MKIVIKESDIISMDFINGSLVIEKVNLGPVYPTVALNPAVPTVDIIPPPLPTGVSMKQSTR